MSLAAYSGMFLSLSLICISQDDHYTAGCAAATGQPSPQTQQEKDDRSAIQRRRNVTGLNQKRCTSHC